MHLWVAALALLLFGRSTARASDFNDLLPGAKAMGLGTAWTSVAEGPMAIFHNPAGTANAPYAELATSLGKLESPRGPLALGALGYVRPYDPIKTATIGAAYSVIRQQNGGDKDVFAFHYSQEFKLPEYFLARPLKVGGNFKVLNVEQGGGTGFGAGFDVGALARSNIGLSGAFTIIDLTTKVGVERPTFAVGLSYLWKRWLTAAVDMRVRSNLTEFYPGLEAAFHQGLIKARLGRAPKLDGAAQVAVGLGFNFSPIIIDAALLVPWAGIYRRGGGYQASMSYRFGAPPFAGNFVGSAATQAENLREEIQRLEERRDTMRAEARAAESNRESAAGEAKVMEERVRGLHGSYSDILKKKEETAYQLTLDEQELKNRRGPPPEPPKPKPRPKPEPWPKRHAAAAGETLRSIAAKYYGDPAQWERIYEANRDQVERGLPKEGAVLTIPAPKP